MIKKCSDYYMWSFGGRRDCSSTVVMARLFPCHEKQSYCMSHQRPSTNYKYRSHNLEKAKVLIDANVISVTLIDSLCIVADPAHLLLLATYELKQIASRSIQYDVPKMPRTQGTFPLHQTIQAILE